MIKIKGYFGSKISDNMTKTPEGFLICHNVPVARTGWYKYLGKEIGVDDKPGELFDVYRSEEEVFSPKALASFEGKIVTDEHPPDLLDPENAQRYCKGTAMNIRRGTKDKNLVLADLVIYNEKLIQEIQDKEKREVSCGYEYIVVDNGDGTYSQKDIIGNHIAIVDKGRAGDKCRVMDSKKDVEVKVKEEKRKMGFFNGFFSSGSKKPATDFLTARGIKEFAKDAEPEEIMVAVDAIAKERTANDELPLQEEVKPQAPPAVPKEGEDDIPSPQPQDGMAQLVGMMERLTEMVGKALQPKLEQSPENALDELIGEAEKGCDKDPEEEEVIESEDSLEDGIVSDPSDRPENPIPGADSAINVIKAKRQMLNYITDETKKKAAMDSLTAEIKALLETKPAKKNGYSKILNNQKQKANDKIAEPKAQPLSTFNYDKYNAHYQGGDK